jgi:hypothetical protein
MNFPRKSFRAQLNRASWSSGNGVSGSAGRQSSISQVFSNGRLRISARTAVPSLSRHACSGDRRACRRPDVAGSKARDEIMRGLRILHGARHGRRGRHFLLYRVAPGGIIENRAHPARKYGLGAPPAHLPTRRAASRRARAAAEKGIGQSREARRKSCHHGVQWRARSTKMMGNTRSS